MRKEEHEIQIEILRLMQDGRTWTNGRLKQIIGQEIRLSAGDTARANFRANEAKWVQLVNNALSPSRSNSLHAKGAVERTGFGQYRITEKGRSLLKQEMALRAAFSETATDVSDWSLKN